MNKKIIKKALIEAKFMAKAEDIDKLIPKLGKDDMVKLVDENQETDITEDENERAGRSIEYGQPEGELTDNDWAELHQSMNEDEQTNPDKLRLDVAKFIDKLNLGQFEAILAKIDKPIEQAEIITAFAERIGVPRAKLPMIIASIKNVTENANPKISKGKLVEFVNSFKK